MNYLIFQILIAVLFLTTIFFHIVRKNTAAILLYVIQSLAIGILLLNAFFEEKSIPLLLVILTTILLKVFVAPRFLLRLVHKQKLTLSASTYLNTPLTLIVLSMLVALAHSDVFAPLGLLRPDNTNFLFLTLSAILISFFLIMNRKGTTSQMIGILSLENSIVAFTFLAGLEQSPSLQIGILFDIFIWIGIATVFVSMAYKHFGSVDTTSMNTLKD